MCFKHCALCCSGLAIGELQSVVASRNSATPASEFFLSLVKESIPSYISRERARRLDVEPFGGVRARAPGSAGELSSCRGQLIALAHSIDTLDKRTTLVEATVATDASRTRARPKDTR